MASSTNPGEMVSKSPGEGRIKPQHILLVRRTSVFVFVFSYFLVHVACFVRLNPITRRGGGFLSSFRSAKMGERYGGETHMMLFRLQRIVEYLEM